VADVGVDGEDLVVRLRQVEKVMSLHGDLRVPRTSIRSSRVVANAMAEVPRWRFPGTGVPGRVKLGTFRGRQGRAFAVVYGRGPGLVIELDGMPFDRVVLSLDDPERLVEQLAA
jgi:hypothetical protein